MAYIRVIGADEAEGKLFSIYDEVQRKRGRLSNILSVESLDPDALEAHLRLYMSLLFGKGALPRRERELIAVAVSAANGCDYCVSHHEDALGKYAEPGMAKALAKDPAKAALEPRERALVDFAVGLTREPDKGRREAAESLREAGFTDEQILHAVQCTSYFNFVNRLASGLGVELESDGDRDYYY